LNGLYDLAAVDTATVSRLSQRALALRGGAQPSAFPGRALGLLFFDPSLRTQASFQRAAGLMSLDLVHLAGNVWSLESEHGAIMDGDKEEHVKEAALALGRYVDILGVRSFGHGKDRETDLSDPVLRDFAKYADVPVINLESARFHPCQALADRVTLDQLAVPVKSKFVLTWAWQPKPASIAVAQSTLLMAAQRGMDVVMVRPDGYDLEPDVMSRAKQLASAAGGSLTVSNDCNALEGATAIYAQSWGCLADYGDAAAEARRRWNLRGWRVEPATFTQAPNAKFMHCLPVRRNVVVADEVLDSARSVVIEQAENRLWGQAALLEEILASNAPRRSARPRSIL
jgi:ornithine carbamoyltransferase